MSLLFIRSAFDTIIQTPGGVESCFGGLGVLGEMGLGIL